MLRASAIADDGPIPYDVVVLAHDERHLRRRALTTVHDETVLVDLPAALRLRHGQRLVLDDGRHVEIIAAEEPVYEITAKNGTDLARIAWHLGNRHARAQVDAAGITILRDHVLRDMLIHLGAEVRETSLPFEPDPPALHGIPHQHKHD